MNTTEAIKQLIDCVDALATRSASLEKRMAFIEKNHRTMQKDVETSISSIKNNANKLMSIVETQGIMSKLMEK